MAELVDALASGASDRKVMRVRLSPAAPCAQTGSTWTEGIIPTFRANISHMLFFLPILLGSAREGRVSDKAAAYIAGLVAKRSIETAIVDPRDYSPTALAVRSHPEPWNAFMTRADGLIIVAPEYNHGYSAPLKAMIDSLHHEYLRKPVAICGCSAGGLGGARVVEQLREVVVELGMVPIKTAVYFSNHMQLWNDDGSIKDPTYESRINILLDELVWYAEVLKNGRETRPFPFTA